MNNNNQLKRSLTLPMITFYGLGNILGAGIYVLVGKVAADAGYFTPLSFFLASIVAGLSALSYAELAARYPVSAGVAVYLYEGFHKHFVSRLVGIMICLAGIISAGALSHGFAGYFSVFLDAPSWFVITVMILTFGVLAIYGISESVMAASLLTLVEIIGLLMIMFVGMDQVPEFVNMVQSNQVSVTSFAWTGIFAGAFLAFYAYIGFEDMVNVAEEVKQPEKNMPRAILLAVIISTLLYAGVAIIAVMSIAPEQLAQSAAPLADVYVKETGNSPVVISLISMVAVVNGVLIQLIMSSRILYGMACKGWLPEWLTYVSVKTQTPVFSTLVVVALILFFALLLPLVQLAELTSYLILTVFVLVNLALLKIKKSLPQPEGVRVFTPWIPRLGFVSAAIFLIIKIFDF